MSHDPRLPHRYPFRLVDRQEGEHVVVALTIGAAWCRRGELPAILAIEMLAQAAALLISREPVAGASPGYLAGLEDVELPARLVAGDRLLATATLERRFGALVKVRATLHRGDEMVARGGLLLATGR